MPPRESGYRFVIIDSKCNILASTNIGLAYDLAKYIAFLNPGSTVHLLDYDNNETQTYRMSRHVEGPSTKGHHGSQEMPYRPGLESNRPRMEHQNAAKDGYE